MIRETGHRVPSDGQVFRNAGHGFARGGESHDVIDGRVNGIEELQTKVDATASEPTPGLRYRRRLRPQTERGNSPFAQFSFCARPNLVPRNALRFTAQGTACAQFNFGSPGGFDFGRVLCGHIVEARQELSGDPGAFVELASRVPLAEVLVLETSCGDSTP